MTEALEAESDTGSHLGEGMLLKNPRSSVKTEDIKLWMYLYGIPLSVEIKVPCLRESRLGHAQLGSHIRADAQGWDEVPNTETDQGRVQSL